MRWVGFMGNLYCLLTNPNKPCIACPLNHRHQQPIQSISPSTHKQIQSVNPNHHVSSLSIMHPTDPARHPHAQSGEPTQTIAQSQLTADRENEPPRNFLSISSPTINFCSIEAPRHPPNPRQENCFALACHLLSHICHT